MVAIGKDHLGASLQANAALVLPLSILIIGIKLPAATGGLLAPPFLLAFLLHQVALKLLQEWIYYSCIPWPKNYMISVHEGDLKLKNFPTSICYAYRRIL